MKKRIIVSVSSDLSTDQRVLKICTSLYNDGYDVLLWGRLLKNSQTIDLPYKTKRFRLFFNSGFLFYAELNIRLFFSLLLSKADLFYANDTDTLAANFLAAKCKNLKFIFDAHELFPEVPELVGRPLVKTVWTKLEDWILPRSMYNLTVCASIANHYHKKYGTHFEVVRNVPVLKHTESAIRKFGDKKVLIYQGAVNIGRGLELVIDAMQYLPETILWIIGDGDIKISLENRVKDKKLEDRIIFEGKVAAEQLRQLTMSADIGLCLLENKGLSYYYSLPNRIFDYMHAGIPVLTTPFPEISLIVDTYKTGVCTAEENPEKLAAVILQMLSQPFDTSHFAQLSREFCWEQEQLKMLHLVKKALY